MSALHSGHGISFSSTWTTRNTSSGDVIPALIFAMESSRSGTIPACLAAMRMSASLTRSLISFLMALVGRKNS